MNFKNTVDLRVYLLTEVRRKLSSYQLDQIVEIRPYQKRIGSRCHAQYRLYKGRPELKCFETPPDRQIFPNGEHDFGNMKYNEDALYFDNVIGPTINDIVKNCLEYAEGQMVNLRTELEHCKGSE